MTTSKLGSVLENLNQLNTMELEVVMDECKHLLMNIGKAPTEITVTTTNDCDNISGDNMDDGLFSDNMVMGHNKGDDHAESEAEMPADNVCWEIVPVFEKQPLVKAVKEKEEELENEIVLAKLEPESNIPDPYTNMVPSHSDLLLMLSQIPEKRRNVDHGDEIDAPAHKVSRLSSRKTPDPANPCFPDSRVDVIHISDSDS